MTDVVSKHPEETICCTSDFKLPGTGKVRKYILAHRHPFVINELLINMSAEYGFT